MTGRYPAERLVDAVACWLVTHGQWRIAERLWRTFRMF